MKQIELSIKNAFGATTRQDVDALKPAAQQGLRKLTDGSGLGSDFLGWVKLPSETPASLLDDINATAADLRANCDTVVVIGIGGSYLGAKAVIEALSDSFQAYRRDAATRILFAGQNIGEDYLYELSDYLKDKKFGIIVISKSGTTTEPAIAFRLLKDQLEHQLGREEASKRIVAVTDASRGALRSLATQEGYKTYVIPDNVGGRFSVLTPVGLLPIAVAGFDIHALVEGAAAFEEATLTGANDMSVMDAETRNALYRAGKKTEILVK